VWVSLEWPVDSTFEPGAKMSTDCPQLLYEALLHELPEDPPKAATVIALGI